MEPIVYFKYNSINNESDRTDYKHTSKQLEERLLDLLGDTNKSHIKVRAITIDNNSKQREGNPISKIFLYDNLGGVALNHAFYGPNPDPGYASFTIKLFPSSQGEILADEVGKLMGTFGFRSLDSSSPGYDEQLENI